MRRLILLRHAKSSWEDPSVPDHERPLTARGQKAVPLTAAWLGERGFAPDLVLCSSARRARETAERLGGPMALPEPVVEDALYHADAEALRERLAAVPAEPRTVMVIGHQPTLGTLARRLSASGTPGDCARAFGHFPTAAAAVIEFDMPAWDRIGWGRGRFVAFAVPRELAGRKHAG